MDDLPEDSKPAPKARAGRQRPRSIFGPRCAICRHPDLFRISAELAAGTSQRTIAKRYGVSHPTVARHFKEHVAAALIQHNIAEPVLAQLRRLAARIDRLCTKAEQAEDLATAVRAAHEIKETLMGIAKITGEDKSSAEAEPVTVEIIYVDRPRLLKE
jgi:hypothetical protein